MKKDSLVDYSAFILIKLLGPLVRSLPRSLAYALGGFIGELFYGLDLRHKSIAYANIKTAFSSGRTPAQLSFITKEFYRNFGRNIMDVFFIPAMDKDYLNKYVTIEGMDNFYEAQKRGKGVIILTVHAGAWELTNVISSNLGVSMAMLVRDQRYPRLGRLLNAYRINSGGNFIQRSNYAKEGSAKFSSTARELINALKENQVLGMTMDQGGRHGVQVKFFGKAASMSSGAVKLALKHDAAIIPVFFWRQKGPYLKVIIEPIFNLKKTQDYTRDVQDNLQQLVSRFQEYILRYPKEYLWSYKIYKYSQDKNILILSDNKAGHLRQSQGLAKIICGYCKTRGINTKVITIDVSFKSKFSRYATTFSGCLAGKYHCQGCSWCLKTFLKEDSYRSLISFKPDIVISCGSGIAAVNFVVSRENAAKSAVIMRPSIFSMDRFDLVVMPKHDNPPQRKNVALTSGSLNLIDQNYLDSCAAQLSAKIKLGRVPLIGFFVGGDTKDSSLGAELTQKVIEQIKQLLEKIEGELLITTSRRTSPSVEQLLKNNFANHKRCRLLIIANENNPDYVVGGILALSQLVVVSAESISMVSEAASSGRYVVVFKSKVSPRHNRFLKLMSKQGYIYLSGADELSAVAQDLLRAKPKIKILEDDLAVKRLLARIL